MRITINLATRTYLNQSQLNLIFGVALLLLVIMLGINIKSIATTLGETTKINNELKALNNTSGSSGRKVPESEYQELVKQIQFANAIIFRKTFSWLALLDKLETVIPEGVSLKQIEPDSRDNLLKLTGTTVSFPKLRIMLENMEDSKDFSDIYLLTQSEARVGDTQKGIAFSMTSKVKK